MKNAGYPSDVGTIKEAFFHAMMNGYAADAPKSTIAGLPGSKAIVISYGEYTVTDFYHVAENSEKGFGTTMIQTRGGQPVWCMHYEGWYEKKVVPFVKRALIRNYAIQTFTGGRGPFVYSEDDVLLYTNTPNFSSFLHFQGREKVTLRGDEGTIFGWHEYHGMYLGKID